MGAEGKVRFIVSLATGDLDQYGSVVDIRVGDLDSELDISPATPSSRSHQNELPLGKHLVEFSHGLSHSHQFTAG